MRWAVSKSSSLAVQRNGKAPFPAQEAELCQCVDAEKQQQLLPHGGSPLKNNRKGREKRASYSIEKKAEVILEAYKSGMTQEKVTLSLIV